MDQRRRGRTGRRIGGAAIGTGRLGESDGWRKEVEERVNVALVYLNGQLTQKVQHLLFFDIFTTIFHLFFVAERPFYQF